MKKLIFILMVAFLMLPIGNGQSVVIDDWYPIYDWEVDVCSNYGGTALAQKSQGGTATGSSYMFLTTVTLQGEKTVQEDEDGTINIYEYAWYFRPMDGDQQYKVEVIGTGGTRKIYEGTATKELGDSGYHAEESQVELTRLKITYETGSLLVPIVENEQTN